VYINHKKCFAFVELKSIELTTACLELDGVVYRNSVLKVQRANEYKPEAVGPHGARPTVKLSLPQEVFSGTVAVQAPTVQDSSEPRLTSLILQGSMASIERGAVVLLGFPFDEGSRRSPTGRPGGANGPKIVRRCISRLGSLANPELGVDIGNVQLIDIGDIPVGLTLDEAHARLAQVVAEVIHRGGTPFVIGGSNDMSYFSAAGLMAVAGGSMGVANVSSQLHVKPPNSDNKIHSGSTFRLLLEDTRFCPPRNGLSSMPSCDGKLLNFGCQGSLCSTEQARYMSDRNARTMWLSKDVRTARPPMNSPSSRDSGVANTPVAKVFGQALAELAEGPDGPAKLRRPLMLALNLEAISCASCPGVANFSTLGLTAEEALEMSFVAGADPNVVLVDVSEFNPDAEEPRTAKLVADMFYYYVMGVASRTPAKVLRDSSSGYRTVNGLQFQTSSELGLSSHSLSSQNLSSHGVGTSAHGVGAPMQFSSMQPGKAVSSHSSLGMLGVGGGHGAISRGGSTPMLTDLNDSDPNLSRMRNNSINSLHGVDSPKRSGGGVLGYW
jgi:arginase family enzyme